MTKHEWTVMRDFLEAVKDAVDFDAIGSRLGCAANAAEGLLSECKAEGFDAPESIEETAMPKGRRDR